MSPSFHLRQRFGFLEPVLSAILSGHLWTSLHFESVTLIRPGSVLVLELQLSMGAGPLPQSQHSVMRL